MIEKNLERIADALEALVRIGMTGMSEATQDAPAKAPRTNKRKDTPTPTTDAPALTTDLATDPASAGHTYTHEDLVDMLRNLVKQNKTEKAKEILKKYGADRVSNVKKEDYAAIGKEMEQELNRK